MKYDKLIQILKENENKKILITGPQRAGTRFASKVIANDLNIEHIDELDYEIGNLDLFLNLIKNKTSFSVQAPALTFYLDKIPDDIIVIFMYRDINDIITSQKRIKWYHDKTYKKIYKKVFGELLSNINMDKPISDIKYQVWEKIQKPTTKKINYDLDYDSLSSHEMWIDKSKRKKFKASQTK